MGATSEGIAGNKTADVLARTGSEHPFAGPERVRGISIRVVKKAVREWTNRNHITGNPQLNSNRPKDQRIC
jgi:hypothetical protein